jgi:hypothetical protein
VVTLPRAATLLSEHCIEIFRSSANLAAGLQNPNVDFVESNGESCVTHRDLNYVLQAAQIFVLNVNRNWRLRWCRKQTFMLSF